MIEPVRKISWVDVFAGMGVAFWLSHSLRERMPDDFLPLLAIACFAIAGGVRLYLRDVDDQRRDPTVVSKRRLFPYLFVIVASIPIGLGCALLATSGASQGTMMLVGLASGTFFMIVLLRFSPRASNDPGP